MHKKRRHGHHGHKKHGSRKRSRSQKRERKPKRPLPQHKVIKKLIQRELDRQGPAIIAQVIRESRDNEMTNDGYDGEPANLTKHEGVQCDGCGIANIIGIRFKCAVCKDFDFCEICEERLTHAHPFIKIPKPELTPASISVALHEGQFRDVQADAEQTNASADNPFNVFAQFAQGRDWRQCAENWMNQQTEREHRGHPFGRGHHGGHHGHHGFRGGRQHFGGMLKDFCRNLNEDPQKRDEVCRNIGSCINQFVANAAFDIPEEHEHRGCNPRRAICTQKPEEVVVGLGKTAFANIKVKNDTKWPWRPGCYLASLTQNACIDIPRVVVDKEVKGGDEFDLIVPISRNCNAAKEPRKEIQVAFYRNDGKQMGTPFTFTVVDEADDQDQLHNAAKQLSEAEMGSFDECLSALMNCNGDEGAALQMLFEAKVKKNAQ